MTKATKLAGGYRLKSTKNGYSLVGGRGTLPVALPSSFYRTKAAALKEARRLVKQVNPAVSVKAVRVKNFTGTITKMPNGQVKVVGRAKKR